MDSRIVTKRVGIVFILLVSLISFFFGISTARAADKLDVRFIVDASSNMKLADPNNNRIRTLQKLIKRLPNDARSGVWTYGKYVNMLVPLGTSDLRWKKQAIYSLDKINAYGNSSNLSSAIEAALHGWQQKVGYKKYLVIVTNSSNTEQRAVLLNKVLPKLKSSGIKLETISFGNKADHRLLKLLAMQTNGKWYQVSGMKYLDSVMAHMSKEVYSKV